MVISGSVNFSAALPVTFIAATTFEELPRPHGRPQVGGGKEGRLPPPGFWMGVINLTDYNIQLRQD